MSSAAEICNRALSALGGDPVITSLDNSDTSQEATHCRIWYDVTRRQLLDEFPWNFATRQAQLAMDDYESLQGRWSLSYVYPSDCIRFVRLLDIQAAFGNDVKDFPAATGGNFANPGDGALTNCPPFGPFIPASARITPDAFAERASPPLCGAHGGAGVLDRPAPESFVHVFEGVGGEVRVVGGLFPGNLEDVELLVEVLAVVELAVHLHADIRHDLGSCGSEGSL